MSQLVNYTTPSQVFLGNNPAYQNAIDQCAKIAQEDYQFTRSTLKETKTILGVLRKGIERQLAFDQNYNNQGQGIIKKDILKQLEKTEEALNTKIIKATNQVIESLYAKERSLKYFTIAFMGRTKAGKSTLHAIMAGEGWEAIGVGKQRTTRLNRVYEWQNIRIIDTPGIGAPGGKSDEEIAQSVIDEADVICYVVTNDSIQETEFQFLQQLKEKAKPLIILLNIKHNLRDARRLEYFLKSPDKIFAKEGKNCLKGHISRIRRYAKEHYSNDYFPIIPVMLLAAQMSQEIEDKQQQEALLKASRIDTFFTAIRQSVIEYGVIRRSQTLLGSTVGNIEEPNQWIKGELQYYQSLIDTLISKSQTMQRDVKKSQKDSGDILEQRITETFQKAFQSIPTFAENHWDADENKLQKGWRKTLNQIKFEEQLNNSYQKANQKFNQEVKETLEEIGQQLQLIFKLNSNKFKFAQQDSETWIKDLFRIGGGVLGAIGAVTLLFLPPVGIIMGITGSLINLSNLFFKSKDQKRREAVNKISGALRSQLKQQQQQILKKARNEFDHNCSEIVEKIDNYFQVLIQELEIISEKLKLANKDLEKNCDLLNRAYSKRIIDYCLQEYQPLTEANINKIIAKVEREFGNNIKITTKQLLELKVTQSQLEQILQEEISITTLTEESLPREKKTQKSYSNVSVSHNLSLKSSTTSIDYMSLDRFLSQRMYDKANLKTHSLMIQASKKDKEHLLIDYMLKEFPREDLMIIDKLWSYYSDGKFGISVQKRIFEAISQKTTFKQDAWWKFSEQVGWCVNKEWFKYTELSFINCELLGHFPALGHISNLDIPDTYWVFRLHELLFYCL